MSDKNGEIEPLTIKLIEGGLAPRFDVPTYELTPVCVNITEQGTVSNLPLVDFVFTHGDQQSVYLGLLACAQTGLEPGALRGEAYLVPFRDNKDGGRQKAQFMVGWKGLIKQARRSKIVRGICAEVVCEADEFDLLLGTEQKIHHRPARSDRGATIGAYSVARLDDGGHEIEWVDRPDLDKIQANAAKRGASPAWADWADQMQRKTAIRRLCKRLPLGPDYALAAALEQANDDGEDAGKILDVFTDGEASRAEDAGSAAAEMAVQVKP